jgi:outer membrane protein assembly factor BamB
VTPIDVGLALGIALWGGRGEGPAPARGAAGPREDRPALDPLRQWGQWRGPLATGVAPHADPPIVWDEERNLRWKAALPGKGHSTPLVWGERVYLTAAVPAEALEAPIPDTSPGGHDNAPITHQQAWVVLALERSSGAPAWQTEVAHGLPHQGAHETASFASASPATDGERIYASFGSRGVYALDMDGRVLWRAELGRLDVKHGHGEGSSPALPGDTLVVSCDHEGPSFAVALDTATGLERWRVSRDEETSWSSPLALEHAGVPQVIVPGTKRIRSYRLKDGALLWECGGLSHSVVASPVAGDGLLFAGSSYETRRLLAIRLGGEGDLTGSASVVWSRTEGTPYVPSPLLYGDALYVVRHYQNVVTRLGARTGDERPGAFRLPGLANIYASPLGAAGRVYVVDLDGRTAVLEDGDEPRLLVTNQLDDSFAASPAAADGELFLRGERFLYCLAEDRARPPR